MRVTAAIFVVLAVAKPLAADAGKDPPSDGGSLGPVLEEVVLSVGERFLTRSDLELETRVVLVSRGGVEAAFAPIGKETVASVMDLIVSELLIVEEVERLRVFEVSEEEVALEVKRFAAMFAERCDYERFLASQDVGPERLRSIFLRRLRVGRYLEERVSRAARALDGGDTGFLSRPVPYTEEPDDDEFYAAHGPAASVRKIVSELRRRGDVRYVAEATPVSAAARGAGKYDEDSSLKGCP